MIESKLIVRFKTALACQLGGAAALMRAYCLVMGRSSKSPTDLAITLLVTERRLRLLDKLSTLLAELHLQDSERQATLTLGALMHDRTGLDLSAVRPEPNPCNGQDACNVA